MPKVLIKLTFKQVIDSASESDFERKVFQISYEEFLMKSQAYNMEGRYRSFDEIRKNDGRANSLHYKLAIAVTHIIDGLGNKIPGLEDQLGNGVAFETPDVKLITSSIVDKAAHKVQINYQTGLLTLLCITGDHPVLCTGDQTKSMGLLDTFTIKLKDNLSISQYGESIGNYLSQDRCNKNRRVLFYKRCR